MKENFVDLALLNLMSKKITKEFFSENVVWDF